MAMIRVEPDGIKALKDAFEHAGEEYKANLRKLDELIESITRGDLVGPPADELKKKYEAKRSVFNDIARTIDEGQEYMGIKGQKFVKLLDDVVASQQ